MMSRNKLPLSANSGLYSARPQAVRFPIWEAVDFLADMGFEAIDINFPAVILQEEFLHEPMLDGEGWRERMEELRSYAGRRGLRIYHSHAPYHYDYLDTHAPNFQMCCEMMRRSIEATGILGGSHIAVHPVESADRRATLVQETVRALEPLARYAAGFGVRLAVENMRSTRPDTLLEIADRTGADICWDVGHAHICGLDQEEALAFLGSRVKVLHIHDNYGPRGFPAAADGPTHSDLHQPPFLGNLDWDSFLRGLERIGFTGAFNYEVQTSMLPVSMREAHARYLVAAAEELMGRMKP